MIEKVQNSSTSKTMISGKGHEYKCIPGSNIRNKELNVQTLALRSKRNVQQIFWKIFRGKVVIKVDKFFSL